VTLADVVDQLRSNPPYPEINAVRSYITEDKTLPIFPSWLLGSSVRIKDFLNATRIPGATSGVTPISSFSGCPLPDGHSSGL
jgi:hypothetical protein